MIGLFSLAGIAGAWMAAIAGRVADAGHQLAGTRLAALGVLASWGLLALGAHSLAALVAGIVLFDLGVQATQILNQSVIFRAASRGPQPPQHGLHDVLLRRCRLGLGGSVLRVGAGRVGRGQHRGCDRRRGRLCIDVEAMSGLVETRPARRRSIKTALVELARRWGAEQIVPVGNELFRTPIRSASSFAGTDHERPARTGVTRREG